jgi:hypothetical protein
MLSSDSDGLTGQLLLLLVDGLALLTGTGHKASGMKDRADVSIKTGNHAAFLEAWGLKC